MNIEIFNEECVNKRYSTFSCTLQQNGISDIPLYHTGQVSSEEKEGVQLITLTFDTPFLLQSITISAGEIIHSNNKTLKVWNGNSFEVPQHGVVEFEEQTINLTTPQLGNCFTFFADVALESDQITIQSTHIQSPVSIWVNNEVPLWSLPNHTIAETATLSVDLTDDIEEYLTKHVNVEQLTLNFRSTYPVSVTADISEESHYLCEEKNYPQSIAFETEEYREIPLSDLDTALSEDIESFSIHLQTECEEQIASPLPQKRPKKAKAEYLINREHSLSFTVDTSSNLSGYSSVRIPVHIANKETKLRAMIFQNNSDAIERNEHIAVSDTPEIPLFKNEYEWITFTFPSSVPLDPDVPELSYKVLIIAECGEARCPMYETEEVAQTILRGSLAGSWAALPSFNENSFEIPFRAIGLPVTPPKLHISYGEATKIVDLSATDHMVTFQKVPETPEASDTPRVRVTTPTPTKLTITKITYQISEN